MRTLIFAAFLTAIVCSGFVVAQTKHRTKKSTASRKKTLINKRKTVKKMTTEPTKNAAVTTESGLTYIVTKHGTGAQVKNGDTVIINYTGLLTNGAKFDSSLDRSEPFEFPLGA